MCITVTGDQRTGRCGANPLQFHQPLTAMICFGHVGQNSVIFSYVGFDASNVLQNLKWQRALLLRNHVTQGIRTLWRDDAEFSKPLQFFPCLVSCFHRQRQVQLDLQRCPKFHRQQVNGFGRQNIFRLTLAGAGLQQLLDIFALAAGDPVERKNIGTITNFLHRRTTQVITQFWVSGQSMDPIGPFSRFTAPERPVTVQRHWPRHRIIRPLCFTGKLHIHFFVKQPPQQNNGFTRHIPMRCRLSLPTHQHPPCGTQAPGRTDNIVPSCTYLSRRPGGYLPASPPVWSVSRYGGAAHCNDSNSSRAIRWPAAPFPVYGNGTGFHAPP